MLDMNDWWKCSAWIKIPEVDLRKGGIEREFIGQRF